MATEETVRALAHYAVAVCRAERNRPEDLATAFGLDPATGVTAFNEFVLPAPPGLRELRFVVGSDDRLVRFAVLRPEEPLPVRELDEVFGPGHVVPGRLHQPAPTYAYADVVLPDAPQGCAVRADLDPAVPGTVSSVTLHPQPDDD
jgi:hypothetical protein